MRATSKNERGAVPILSTRTPVAALIESPFLSALRQAREFDPFRFATKGPKIAKRLIFLVTPKGGTGKLPPALAAQLSTGTKHAPPTT